MTTYNIDHDIAGLRSLLTDLDRLRSRFAWVAEVLQEPHGFNCFILADSNLVPTERADEVEMRVVYKPTALYQKLLIALTAEEVSVPIVEDVNRSVHQTAQPISDPLS